MKMILLGPPGSGKGTISEFLMRDYSFLHISPGELLREEVRTETTIGKEIKKFIEKGELVPDQFVVEMVKLELNGKDNYILDGFPRSIAQAESITDIPIDLVLSLEVPEALVIERFAGRRTCPKCNTSYHLKNLPPKKAGICDKCGTALIQRADDKPEVIKERFKVYHQNTQPLIDYYKKKKLLKAVDGSGMPEAVYASVKELVDVLSKKKVGRT